MLYVLHMHGGGWRGPEESVETPGTGVTVGDKPPCG